MPRSPAASAPHTHQASAATTPCWKGLAFVIPAYNEAERIGTTLERIVAYAVQHCDSYEVVVVDDGSNDGTVDIVRATAADSDRVRVLGHPGNRGKGYSVRQGVLSARMPYRLITDADLSTPVEELAQLAPFARPDTLVIGSRGLASSTIEVRQPWYRERMGKTFNLLVRALLVPGIRDTQCGFKLVGAAVAESVFPALETDGWAFDVEVIARTIRAGMTVHEVPVRWRHDARTRVHAFGASRQMLRDLVRLAWKLRRRQ
jgi:dolichyl-phosphate beta-glucosyltransferase